jgi:hypothetical protein
VEEEPGTSTRRIAAVEKVSQNTVMEMLNSYSRLTIFSGLRALPLLSILKSCFQLMASSKICAIIPHFLVNILFTDETGST